VSDRAPLLRCLLAAALFGASTPASKALLGGAGPVTAAGLLYLGGALSVAPFALRGGFPRPDRANRRRLLAAVVFGGGVGPILYLLGLRAAPAASVSLWLNMEAVATAILAWGFFRENLDRRAFAAAGVMLLGGALLAAPGGAGNAGAAALVSLACLCWALDNVATSLVDGFTPAQTTFAKGLVAGSVNLGLGLLIEPARPGAGILLGALLVGALGYGASILLYVAAAQELGATRSQMLFSLAPFAGVLLAWTAGGEKVLPLQLAAAASMGFGLFLLLGERHCHEHRHERITHTHAHRHDDGHHDHDHPGLPRHVRHVHEHTHEPLVHTHRHWPDLHHRHRHG